MIEQYVSGEYIKSCDVPSPEKSGMKMFVDVDVVRGENGIAYEENMLSRQNIQADTVVLQSR